jgi:hypothetical protein
VQRNRRWSTPRWRARALAIGVAALLLAGACGGDDDAGGSTDSTVADEPASGLTPAGLATWCSAMEEVDLRIAALSSGQGDPTSTSAAIDTTVDGAPPEIADAVDELAAYNRKIVADAEGGAGETPGAPAIPPDSYFTASAEAGAYMADNCDFENVEVTATEYAFAGLDGDFAAGTTLLRFTNDGDEYHEIDIEKLAVGEERSAEELLDLMETAPDEAAALVTPVALTFAPPHSATYAIFDLEPGRYLAMCHVPVGATPEALASGARLEESDSHLAHGMIAEFTVA